MFYALSARINHLIRSTYTFEFEKEGWGHSLSKHHIIYSKTRDWHEHKNLYMHQFKTLVILTGASGLDRPPSPFPILCCHLKRSSYIPTFKVNITENFLTLINLVFQIRCEYLAVAAMPHNFVGDWLGDRIFVTWFLPEQLLESFTLINTSLKSQFIACIFIFKCRQIPI